MSDIYTIPQIRDALAPVFTHNGVRSAVLFGSYGKGTADEKSDIDLLVDSGLRGLRFVALLDEGQVSMRERHGLKSMEKLARDAEA